MSDTSVRYSPELKKKAVELFEEMSAEEVVEHLRSLKSFKNEAKSLSVNSIYGFKGRLSNGNGNGGHQKEAESERCVQEYMTTFHDNGTVALTLYVSEKKLGQVLKQLKLMR